MKKKQRLLNLLPFYFRNIGLFIILLALLSLFSLFSETAQAHKEVYEVFFQSTLLIGSLFIAIAKGRTEDEMTMLLRIKAYSGTFLFGVFYFVANQIFSLLTESKSIESSQLILAMLIYYFTSFWFLKRQA